MMCKIINKYLFVKPFRDLVTFSSLYSARFAHGINDLELLIMLKVLRGTSSGALAC